MIVQSFRSVMWVGAVAGAALSCYMVSLRVASERASLERVESRILMAKRDIRALDTELVTRGRIRQLERWNVDVLALSAPTEGQFLTGEVQLASLTTPAPPVVTASPVVMAAAPRRKAKPEESKPILASYKPKRDEGEASPRNPLLVRASLQKQAPDKVAPAKKASKADAATPKKSAVKKGAAIKIAAKTVR